MIAIHDGQLSRHHQSNDRDHDGHFLIFYLIIPLETALLHCTRHLPRIVFYNTPNLSGTSAMRVLDVQASIID